MTKKSSIKESQDFVTFLSFVWWCVWCPGLYHALMTNDQSLVLSNTLIQHSSFLILEILVSRVLHHQLFLYNINKTNIKSQTNSSALNNCANPSFFANFCQYLSSQIAKHHLYFLQNILFALHVLWTRTEPSDQVKCILHHKSWYFSCLRHTLNCLKIWKMIKDFFLKIIFTLHLPATLVNKKYFAAACLWNETLFQIKNFHVSEKWMQGVLGSAVE